MSYPDVYGRHPVHESEISEKRKLLKGMLRSYRHNRMRFHELNHHQEYTAAENLMVIIVRRLLSAAETALDYAEYLWIHRPLAPQCNRMIVHYRLLARKLRILAATWVFDAEVLAYMGSE